SNFKIVMTGNGRVAGGALEIIQQLPIKKVSPQDFLNKDFDEAVYTQLTIEDYFKKPDGSDFKSEEAFEHPERFESDFAKYTKVADMYITALFLDARGPLIFTEEDL